jgi:antitoxin (DNA-binding transcriptional repressor) of toxin-antitoxin stability system
LYIEDVQVKPTRHHSLSDVRKDLSRLVRLAAGGRPVAITVRGKVTAWLVAPGRLTGVKAKPLRGSLKLVRPLEDSRRDYLKWMGAGE